MKKIGKLFGCCLPILAALACQLVVSMTGAIVYGVIAALYGVESMSADMLMVISVVATFTTLILGLAWYCKYRPEQELSLKKVCNPMLLVTMVCMGISLQLLISMCLNAVYPILPQKMTDEYAALMESLLGGTPWLSVLLTVVLAPLAEELLFRGVTYRKARKFMPFMAANVLQALLFGIYHLNIIQGVYAFVLGLILGVVCEYFHSIWASVLLHACVNGAAELLGLLPEALTEGMTGVLLFAVVGVVLLFVSVRLFPKARTEIPVEEKFSENSFDEP